VRLRESGGAVIQSALCASVTIARRRATAADHEVATLAGL
jgi:hypothetical protein